MVQKFKGALTHPSDSETAIKNEHLDIPVNYTSNHDTDGYPNTNSKTTTLVNSVTTSSKAIITSLSDHNVCINKTSTATPLPQPNQFVDVISSNANKIICRIPVINSKKQYVSKRNELNSLIWVLDDNGQPVDTKRKFMLHEQYTVIHCVNALDGTYYINVYKVISKKNKLLGNLIFSQNYTRYNLKDIPTLYRSYAEKTVLMT